MARLGERTGRRIHARRLQRAPRRRARDRRDGLGRGDRPRDRGCARPRAASGSAWLQVRLYRPFPARALLDALPASVRRIAVLDRTKEPGSIGEPLFLDVVAALTEAHEDGERASCRGCRRPLRPVVEGVHPGHGRGRVRRARARAAAAPVHRRHQRRRLRHEPGLRRVARHRAARHGPRGLLRARRRTARSARTRTRSRSSGRGADLHAQGYFVYDSKKSGSQTVSHLRFGPRPIRAPYLVAAARASSAATSSGCSTRSTCSAGRRPARRCCSTARTRRTRSGTRCRGRCRSRSSPSGIDVYVDRRRPDRPRGRPRAGGSTSCCRPASSRSPACCRATRRSRGSRTRSPRPTAAAAPRSSSATTRRSTGRSTGCTGSRCPTGSPATRELPPPVPAHAPDVRPHRHRGDDGRPRRRPAGQRAAGRRHLPVRHDGATRSATSPSWSPVWDPDLCIQCGNCSFVCPHSVIRSKYYDQTALDGAPDGFRSAPLEAPGLPDSRYTLQVYVEDCTGCGLCVEACPAVSAGRARPQGDQPRAQREPLVAAERENIAFFETLPVNDRAAGRLRHRARHAVPGAAVRVLRRLRRLRRDALPQAALAAVRRPADGRQRDRLLVDLRRQPPDHAVDDRRRGARPGLVELAVRGQRRVRARLPARRRPAPRAGAPAPRRAARRSSAPSSSTRSWTRRSCASRSSARSASASPSCCGGSTGLRRPARRPTCSASSTTWSGAASGSSAATAGPTTSAPAGSTTCWPAGAT